VSDVYLCRITSAHLTVTNRFSRTIEPVPTYSRLAKLAMPCIVHWCLAMVVPLCMRMLRPALTLYAQIDFLSASAMTLAFLASMINLCNIACESSQQTGECSNCKSLICRNSDDDFQKLNNYSGCFFGRVYCLEHIQV
jgi:hypothetical protein